MFKSVVVASVAILAASVAAAETCYRLGESDGAFSRTPEILCAEELAGSNKVVVTLRTGLSFEERTLATFNFDILERARCFDCNQDLFGIATPSNSVFNKLQIRFNGKTDLVTKVEKGTITIGDTKFFYESL